MRDLVSPLRVRHDFSPQDNYSIAHCDTEFKRIKKSLCQDGNYLDLRISGMSPGLLTPEAGLILSGRATCSCVYLDWPLTDSVREWWYKFLTSDINSIAHSGGKQNQAYPSEKAFLL